MYAIDMSYKEYVKNAYCPNKAVDNKWAFSVLSYEEDENGSPHWNGKISYGEKQVAVVEARGGAAQQYGVTDSEAWAQFVYLADEAYPDDPEPVASLVTYIDLRQL